MLYKKIASLEYWFDKIDKAKKAEYDEEIENTVAYNKRLKTEKAKFKTEIDVLRVV